MKAVAASSPHCARSSEDATGAGSLDAPAEPPDAVQQGVQASRVPAREALELAERSVLILRGEDGTWTPHLGPVLRPQAAGEPHGQGQRGRGECQACGHRM